MTQMNSKYFLYKSLLVAIRRKALKPYTFSKNGPHVPAGEIACVPAWEIMHDEKQYPQADKFDGLRFVDDNEVITTPSEQVKKKNPMRGTELTEASKDFPIWGLGSKVW